VAQDVVAHYRPWLAIARPVLEDLQMQSTESSQYGKSRTLERMLTQKSAAALFGKGSVPVSALSVNMKRNSRDEEGWSTIRRSRCLGIIRVRNSIPFWAISGSLLGSIEVSKAIIQTVRILYLHTPKVFATSIAIARRVCCLCLCPTCAK
jgi:hypothetical protein